MRVAVALVLGIIFGAGLLWASVAVMGGWYTYRTLDATECRSPEIFIRNYQVVPNQPNPCHFRRPRWQPLS